MNTVWNVSEETWLDKKSRIGGIDIAKSVAIIAVVLGHYLQNFVPSYMNYAFCFHVSLFFLLSGYFLRAEIDWHTFINKNADRLLKPYFVTTSIWGCLLPLKMLIKQGVRNAIKQLIKCVYAIIFGGGKEKVHFTVHLLLN